MKDELTRLAAIAHRFGARYRGTVFTAVSVACLVAFPASHSTAQDHHYRWTDQGGETVYSDRPPPAGVDYEIVSSRSNFSRAVKAGEGAVPQGTSSEPETGGAGDTPGDQLARQEVQAEFCTKARANLEALNGSARIVVRTTDGGTRTLSPEEVEEQRRTTQSQISAYCE